MAGQDISKLSSKELTIVRRDMIGLVFQQFHLVNYLTALENVMLAQYYHSITDEKEAMEALDRVGLADRAKHLPSQLSGGEQQRVSIARAVAKNPKLLLCDEPTGALDYKTGKQVLQILQDMSCKQGATVIIVTHNAALAPIADRVIRMHDARIQSVTLNARPQDIASLEY